MRIELYPSIVWTRDEYAQLRVASWHQCLDDRARQFVRVATEWEDVRDALREYARQSFTKTLRDLEIRPTPAGVVVNIAVVASGMGPAAYRQGSQDAAILQQLAHEVTGLKWHLVLLANHEHVEQNDQKCVDPPAEFAVPWLVSSRASDGRTLDDEALGERLARVLDVLLLVSPAIANGDPGALQEVATPAYAGDYVRMAGYSRLDFAGIVKQIADGCRSHMMADCRSATHAAPQATQELLRSADASIGALARGDISVEELLARILGDRGICQWSIQAILVEARKVLATITHAEGALARAAGGGNLREDSTIPGASRPWWRRLLEALGILKRRDEEPVLVRGGHAAECGTALACLVEALSFLEQLEANGARFGQGAYAPPHPKVELWRRHLEQSVYDVLKAAADPGTSNAPDVDRILRSVSGRIELDVAENLSVAIREWARDVRALDETRELLASNRFVLFDGYRVDGAAIHPAAAVGMFTFGDTVSIHGRSVAYARVATWSGVKPFFFVASEPLSKSVLGW
jgi:hypothetical protein